MSTGQPPSDDSSDGEKRSEPGQSTEDSQTNKPDEAGAQSSSPDESWDPRELPTSGRVLAGRQSACPPNSNELLPEFRVIPSGVSSPRGKFTVGHLLNAAQGIAPISQKRTEPLSARPRQQIGALPQSAPARSTVPPANNSTESAANPPATCSPPLVAKAASEVESVVSPSSAQPIAVAAVTESEPGSRPTPSQPFAIDVVFEAKARSRPTPSQPFAVKVASSVEAVLKPTPSQPFGVDGVPDVDAGSRPTPSQPFVVEVVPKAVLQTPMGTGARAERALTPRDLLAPPLIEKTPRGIGAVTLGSTVPLHSRSSNAVAMESTALVVTPIVPIVAGPLAQPAKSDASRSPAPAPENRNVGVNAAPPAIAVEPLPPVGGDPSHTSERAIRVSESDPSPMVAQRSSSSQSKLDRAPSQESGLSGEFFAAPDVTVPPAELRQPQDSDDFIDERQRRSISPEVVARRTRYRAIVVRVIVGFVLLLAAAIVLKLTHKR